MLTPRVLPPGTCVSVPYVFHRDAHSFVFLHSFWPEGWRIASGQLPLARAHSPSPRTFSGPPPLSSDSECVAPESGSEEGDSFSARAQQRGVHPVLARVGTPTASGGRCRRTTIVTAPNLSLPTCGVPIIGLARAREYGDAGAAVEVGFFRSEGERRWCQCGIVGLRTAYTAFHPPANSSSPLALPARSPFPPCDLGLPSVQILDPFCDASPDRGVRSGDRRSQ